MAASAARPEPTYGEGTKRQILSIVKIIRLVPSSEDDSRPDAVVMDVVDLGGGTAKPTTPALAFTTCFPSAGFLKKCGLSLPRISEASGYATGT
jgi:hypothetical protein